MKLRTSITEQESMQNAFRIGIDDCFTQKLIPSDHEDVGLLFTFAIGVSKNAR